MNTFLFAAGFLRHLLTMPPLRVLLWTGLSLVSVAAMFAMRRHWGRIHPLARCAALSLLVHLMFVSLAMTIRLVAAGDGVGHGDGGSPIHVRLVDDAGGSGGTLASVLPPQLLATEVVEPSSSETKPASDEIASSNSSARATKLREAADAKRSTPVEAPDLLPPPPEVPKNSPAIVDVPSTPAKQVADAELAQPPAGTLAEPSTAISANANAQLASSATTTQPDLSQDADASAPGDTTLGIGPTAAALGTGTNPYARRGGASDRLHWAEQGGGGRDTESAVNAALAWLAQSQSPDGRWDASRFGAGREMAVLGQDRGGAGADADAGVSALALLAFLGAGQSQHAGDNQATVRKGLDYLVRGQAADGNLGGDAGLYARMYCHSMATFALAEALAMTGDPALRSPVERAVDYSLRAQNPSTGGWRYRPGDLGDTSQLGWQLMALWSAERAGISVPPQTWTGADRFLRSVRRGQVGGLASYRSDSPASTSMTAEALYCRQLATETLGGIGDDAAAVEATRHLIQSVPEPGRVNLYYWYYASLALHRQQQLSDQNAAAWQAWNNAMSGVLLAKQTSEGAEAGSWAPECIWGGYGGRVYSTALSTLCLEVYYRYAPPALQPDWTATHAAPLRTTK
ncbi:MAG TPA: hypothetical protein VGM76_00420 [Lacipirellulaceae bacterium]|jgi:hypothetical protein